ncbi:MAG: cytochrome C oxidase assembly protein [Rhodobacteraceae bacterium]|nr:cytochrome C oxidase assembly protein [Paracoccaceae bacterium]
MSIKVTHDLHRRRFTRNVGVGLLLVAFIVLIFGLTMVKVTSSGFMMPTSEAME